MNRKRRRNIGEYTIHFGIKFVEHKGQSQREYANANEEQNKKENKRQGVTLMPNGQTHTITWDIKANLKKPN
jgi:hypothetical protein